MCIRDREHPKYYDEFTKVMHDNPSIVACDYLTGDYDFMLKIQTKSSETLEPVSYTHLSAGGGDRASGARTEVYHW